MSVDVVPPPELAGPLGEPHPGEVSCGQRVIAVSAIDLIYVNEGEYRYTANAAVAAATLGKPVYGPPHASVIYRGRVDRDPRASFTVHGGWALEFLGRFDEPFVRLDSRQPGRYVLVNPANVSCIRARCAGDENEGALLETSLGHTIAVEVGQIAGLAAAWRASRRAPGARIEAAMPASPSRLDAEDVPPGPPVATPRLEGPAIIAARPWSFWGSYMAWLVAQAAACTIIATLHFSWAIPPAILAAVALLVNRAVVAGHFPPTHPGVPVR